MYENMIGECLIFIGSGSSVTESSLRESMRKVRFGGHSQKCTEIAACTRLHLP